MNEFENATILNFNIVATINWECPHCNKQHVLIYNPSPYSAITHDPVDEYCDGCENFLTIQL